MNLTCTETHSISTKIPSHDEWHEQTKFIQLPTGIRMAYMEVGNPKGKTLLMIHGFTDSSRIWRMAMDKLKNTFHIFAVDLRGFGQSDKPLQFVYSMSQHAEDIISFMDACNITSAHILAHSMGSMIAQTIAFSAPERVDSLVLASTMTHMHETLQDIHQIHNLYETLNLSTMDAQAMQELFLPYPENCFDTEFPSAYIQTLRGVPSTSLVAAWYGMSLTDNRNFLQFIKAPVLILWGTDDEIFTSEYQDEVKQYLPNAHFIALNGISHEIPTQIPLEMANYASEFFSQV